MPKNIIMAAIHLSQLFEYVQTKKEFSITWISESGEKIFVSKARVTSFHSSGSTLNIECVESGQIRKVNRNTIIEIDGMEVYI